MLELPTFKNGWKLDVVSLLAVIGESSMSQHTLPLTASRLCLLPRLIPAPQALLKSSRPAVLSSRHSVVVGVHSGIHVQELNFFANLLHPISDLPPYTVREFNIQPSDDSSSRNRGEKDPKAHPELLEPIAGAISPRKTAPLFILTIASTFLSIGLLVWAFLVQDLVAVLAILTISFASSIIGLASLWQPKLGKRQTKTKVPRGDLVVRARQGAFLIIHCPEEVTRELYIGTEECHYVVGDQIFKALVGVGTFMLMVAVVLMGNCTWVMQAALSSTYILLNGLYWIAALFKANSAWDLSRYEVKEKRTLTKSNFTEALWASILATKKTKWVKTSRAIPESEAWKAWLHEASENVENEKWDPTACLKRCLEEELAESGS